MSSKRVLCVLGAVFLLFAASGCNKKAQSDTAGRPTMRIGFMICNSEAETMSRFAPLCKYLSEKMNINFVPVPINTIDFEQAVRDKKVDFTHTNSLLYVILNKNYGVDILAGDVRGQYGRFSRGAIMVRKDSPIKTIADLKDKRLVFGPAFAPTGYLSQYYLMLKNGFNPETGLRFYTTPHGAYKHDKVIYALMYGAYDAAAVPMLDFELLSKEGRIDPSDFRIIAEEKLIPYCGFGVCENVKENIAGKFKKILLNIKPGDTVDYQGERLKVLKAAWVDGFAQAKDSDYDFVREMAKTCNMPPYQKF